MSIAIIQRKTAAYFGITVEELLGKCRERRVSEPRQLAMAIAYESTGKSTAVVARAFGRDHTTVCHALRQVARKLVRMDDLAEAKAAIERACGIDAPHVEFRHRSSEHCYAHVVARVEPLP